jgi:CHAD domain-containing protein
MAYRFRKNENVGAAFQRMVQEEMRGAVRALQSSSDTAAASGVHEARKAIKRVRSLLRLMRSELGPAFRPQNEVLREASHRLSPVRDAEAMLEAFCDLRDWEGRRFCFPAVENALRAKRDNARRGAARLAHVVVPVFSREAGEALRLPVSAAGFPAVEAGLRKSFSRGRKAWALVNQHPTDRNYHDWRKRVKDFRYQLCLLEPAEGRKLLLYQKRVKRLEKWLGDDHNLTVFRDALRKQPRAYGDPHDVSALLDQIKCRQESLRQKSRALGKALYRSKPGAIARRVRRRWNAWKK